MKTSKTKTVVRVEPVEVLDGNDIVVKWEAVYSDGSRKRVREPKPNMRRIEKMLGVVFNARRVR